MYVYIYTPSETFTKHVDPNGSCLFAAGSPTNTVGSQSFQTFSTRQTPHLGNWWGELTSTTTKHVHSPTDHFMVNDNSLPMNGIFPFVYADRAAVKSVTRSNTVFGVGTGLCLLGLWCSLHLIYWLTFDRHFYNESVMSACPFHIGNRKGSKTKWYHMYSWKLRTFFVIISFVILNIQMSDWFAPPYIYIYIYMAMCLIFIVLRSTLLNYTNCCDD